MGVGGEDLSVLRGADHQLLELLLQGALQGAGLHIERLQRLDVLHPQLHLLTSNNPSQSIKNTRLESASHSVGHSVSRLTTHSQ